MIRTILRGAKLTGACIACLFPAACFSTGDGTGPALEDCVRATSVTMTDALRFDAECVRVSSGETVLWTNPSPQRHTVTADPTKAANPANVSLPDGTDPFDSGWIPPGGNFEYTFSVPGRYDYVCLPHENDAMVGTVIVEE
ncbi:MAG: hypothetical protein GEU90_08500 [Gemmatimonas sp.]|nr:hypothetical protein [Gemmatimonas sp.]